MAKELSSSKTNTGDEPKLIYHNLTPFEHQAMQIEKLMKRIDKPIEIPKSKTVGPDVLKPPKEFMTNIPGSSAGAGSGDFHIYRAHRRREYTRVKLMEAESRREQENNEYLEERNFIRQQEEAKTAKRRAKRQKRNQKSKEVSKSSPNPSASPSNTLNSFKMCPNPDALKDINTAD